MVYAAVMDQTILVPAWSQSQQVTSQSDNNTIKLVSPCRSGFGCQTTLLRMLEDWRQALDCRNQVGAILMDLSKAFDCLPHDLFLRKLQTYGASGDAVRLMGSYQ